MISVQEAKEIILKQTKTNKPMLVSLDHAFGYILAEDIFTITDIPGYPQSSVDGYAFLFNDINETLTIVGEMAAGTNAPLQLHSKQAARIFTGAPLPNNADTVVMQEKAAVENNFLTIKDEGLQRYTNVRAQGSEIKKNALAMKTGTYLSAAAIGFLSGIGISNVKIFPAPSVTIIVTGNELQIPGFPLEFGQVYESSSLMLSKALEKAGIKSVNIIKVKDDFNTLKNCIDHELHNTDVLIITGGVSVGDYDFAVKALTSCGVIQHFHKIKQRPGKPLFFGTKEEKIVFGLPGNPSSSLVCFYEYVLPMLENMMQKNNSVVPVNATITCDYKKTKGLTHFLKGNYADGMATFLHAQESYKMQSFAEANCLILLEEEKENYKSGDLVEVHILTL